ncbi:hypothetical protein BKA70DRAFT_1102403 [Coprinopsis sp. MPI-PUGE-AT-0042]|nr:hypothetical protein BKA70DRAFT_1102403 [Coprinopsis sp. MPI-PUGE-AT-0042]
MPISSSALKQKAKANIKAQWTQHWEDSPQKPRLKHLNTTPLFKGFLKISQELNRDQISTLVQLCTGHFPLNNYLYKRKLSPTDKCEKCTLRRWETIDHITKECPAHLEHRRALQQVLQLDIADPKKVLGDKMKARAMITFMGAARLGLYQPHPRSEET